MAEVIYCKMNGRILTLCSTPDVYPKHTYQKNQTVMITGLRPHQLYWEDEEAYKPLKLRIDKELKLLYDKGYRKFLVCGRPGIELLAAEVMCDMKIRRELYDVTVSMYVPYDGFEFYFTAEGIFSQVYLWKLQNFLDEVWVSRRHIDPSDNVTKRQKAVDVCLDKAIRDSSKVVVYSVKNKEDSYIKHIINQARVLGSTVERYNL